MKTYVMLAISFCMLMAACFAVAFIWDVIKAAWFALKDKPYRWRSFEAFTKCKDWKVILLLGTIICVGAYGFFARSSDIVRSEYETEDEFCNLCGTYLLNDDDSSKCYHNYVYCDYCGADVPEEFVFISTEIEPESYANAEAKKAALEAAYGEELTGNSLSQGTINKIYDQEYEKAYNYALNNAVCHNCVYRNYREIIDAINERPYAFSEDVFYVKKAECAWCGNPAPEDLRNLKGDPICIDCISKAFQDSSISRALETYSEDK